MRVEYIVEVTRVDKDVPFKDRQYKIIGKDTNGEDKYEYEYFDNHKDVKTKVYEQTVSDLEVSEIAKVVNGIETETIVNGVESK